MFKRLQYEDWLSLLPIISFAIAFIVFLGISLKAIFMKKDKVEHMSHLPLDSEIPTPSKSHGTKR